MSLDRAINNTIHWLNDIQSELGWEDKEVVYHATKAFLQATRDRLPIEETAHLSANLPLIMKGMLMDGYHYKEKPSTIRTEEEFYEYIQQYYNAQRRDIINPKDVVRAVVNVFSRRMGGGEMQKVAANLPERIRRLFESAIINEDLSAVTENDVELAPTST